MGMFDDLTQKSSGLFSDLVAKSEPLTRTDKFLRGMKDPVDAGAQLLTNILPDSIVQAGNKANNWLADNTGLVGRLPEGGVDQQVREGEKQYQAQRLANGESGIDGYRIAGNMVSPANLAVASKIPAATSLGSRVLTGAYSGGLFGALTPVGEGDFTQEKLKQIGMGAAVGGVMPVVTGSIARVISPNSSRNPNLQLLKDEGVSPTIGQTLGGRWNTLEEKMQSVPLMGDAISMARQRSLKDFNNAAINRASGEVGVNVEGAGQSAVKEAGDVISKSYNDSLSKINGVQLDGKFNNDLMQLRSMAQNLVPTMKNKFNDTVNNSLLGRVSKNGSMLPETYKVVDSDLGSLASQYGKSSVASEQELGGALSQLQNLLKQQMMRSNPQVAGELNAADSAWANLVRVEAAAKSAKNAEGIFTPGQLNMAIQTADDSVRKRAVARGTALMQDLGNAGQQVLGNKVPDSGTAGRLVAGGGALGSYFINPAIPASLIGGAAMYSPVAQSGLNALVSSRPAFAKPVSDMFRKAAPALLPASAQIGFGLLDY